MLSWSTTFVVPRAATLATCGLALGLAACGGDRGPTSEVRLAAAADGSLRFDRRSVRAPAGRLSIEMPNPSAIPHAIAVRGEDAEATGEAVGRGEVSRVTVDLAPGDYVLVCPVGGHEEAGMTAELRVDGGG